MKKIIALSLLAVLFAPAAFATYPVQGPVFTHFHNYDAAKKSYSKKSYSTLGNAQSAELLINGTTGLCFSGVEERADALVNQMIDTYNNQEENEGAELSLTDFSVVKNDDYRKTTLRFSIGQRTPDGVAQISFERVRRCI
ncbi:MAG: hypothetical protein EOP11_25245 [Proteobacteria bacterium]|nr:MAG: hypothetical protein EOP11_25245 [Pseudomonadota bacterium]